MYPDEAAFLKAGQIIDREMDLKGRVDFDTTLMRRDGRPFRAHVSITGFGKRKTWTGKS